MCASQVGLIGLAVMGQNLVLNMLDKGLTVSVFNRTEARTREMESNAREIGKESLLKTTYDIKSFVDSLSCPRKIILLVRSGQPVDEFIEKLLPYCSSQDIVVDAGNSNFNDTIERCTKYNGKLIYCGCGVSGGEEGARTGPSIMPGGDKRAAEHLMPIFEKIAGKAKEDNLPCTTWVGSNGSGHFVKMVHNGIEYGDMQIICEAYDIMKRILKLDNQRIADVFSEWNKGKLKSYLIEITALICSKKTEDGKSYILDTILDKAGQKGTGKWTVTSALDSGSITTVIAESVFARITSSLINLRLKTSLVYPKQANNVEFSEVEAIKILHDLEQAVYCSKITSYTQGFMLISQKSLEMDWNVNLPAVAKIFRNGCIIRSQFLNDIAQAYERNPSLECLYLDKDYFAKELTSGENGWRNTIINAINGKVPVPCISNALQFFDSLRSSRLPANLIQAQRDFFGAHTYERIDNPGVFVHTKWTAHSGNTTSNAYNA